MFYDFHVNEDLNLIKEAERLGYAGLALFRDENQKPAPFELSNLKDIEKEYSFKLYKGVLIRAKNPEDMKQKVKRQRKEADIIMIQGGDQKINRAASEDPRVDIISMPYFNRRDCGINHVIAKKAAQNEVAVELNMKYLTRTSSYLQYKVLSYFREIIKLKEKFNFPIIITSNAKSIYDLQTPQDLIALSKCFGMDQEEAVGALSLTPMNIIERSKIRDKIIVDGVKSLN